MLIPREVQLTKKVRHLVESRGTWGIDSNISLRCAPNCQEYKELAEVDRNDLPTLIN